MEKYAEARLSSLGFDPSRDFGILDVYSGEVGGKKRKPRMWPDDDGNLCIGVVDLDNQFITLAPELSFSKSSREILHIKRLANPDPEGGKYRPGKIGQGVYPCFWNFTLDCFVKKTKVKTLVITEGYLKAYILDKSGILSVGLPGITVWKEKNQQDIFTGLRALVDSCEVENIVWLTDGDTMKVEWVENKDLSKRPWSFFTSIRIFKEKTLDLGCNQFWFHIHDSQIHKGIDDLILAEPESLDQIKKELTKVGSTDGLFFKRFNVSAMSYEKIREYFGIHEGAEGFFKKHEDKIGSRPFVYGKGLYQYNEEIKKLEYIRAGEAAQFCMIDSTYYIKGAQTTIHGTIENVLKPTKMISIHKMFQHKSKSELSKIIYDIPHYNGFINRPSHTDYKKLWEVPDAEGYTMKYYNKYHPLSWNPEPGNCPLSLQFIKHVFGTGTIEYKGKTYNEWDLGLDYIQLLYLNPTQKLPILCLVSEEGSTGKTKFWEWIASIFQQNVKEIASDQLTGQFTTYFASCLLCYIDEAFIDRIHVVEKLKQLVTSKKTRLEGKFENADTIDNFLKIGLSSNNVRNFANIRFEEMRFWIRELHKIPEDQYDPYFEEKLLAEIPAFLHFLQNRTMVTERVTRLHFANELIATEALEIVKKESRSGVEIMLEMCIQEYISNCKQSIVRLSPRDLKTMLDDATISLAKIRWGLLKFGIEISPHSNVYDFYSFPKNSVDDNNYISTERRKSATYKLPASLFFTPEQCVEIFDKEQLLKLEAHQLKNNEPSWFAELKDRSILLSTEDENSKIALEKAGTYQDYIDVINHIPF